MTAFLIGCAMALASPEKPRVIEVANRIDDMVDVAWFKIIRTHHWFNKKLTPERIDAGILK